MGLKIIQPGMGVGVSNYRLANIASRHGCIGTVSGPGCEQQIARILENGDPDGDIRRALRNFPIRNIGEKIIDKYFVEGGIKKGIRYKGMNTIRVNPSNDLIELIVASNFAIVWLAKEGHDGLVSINYLEKIQMTLIHCITGAMLAGVDFVTMGAGLPYQIPAVLKSIANGESPHYIIDVVGMPGGYVQTFDTEKFFGKKMLLKKPGFLPIVSTNFVADTMVRKTEKGSIQAFIVENNDAGGHSANPRKVDGKIFYDEFNEPIYGGKDDCDFVKLKKDHGIPFYIAGGQASPEALKKALEIGAEGIQVGSIFALSQESGLAEPWKSKIRKDAYNGKLIIINNPMASPTGFPFKVVSLEGTVSEEEIYNNRKRICDLSYLVTPYVRPNGEIGYRCPAEPIDKYLKKKGINENSTLEAREKALEETKDVVCLCNGLHGAIGFENPNEPPVFTLGKNYMFLIHLMKNENSTYSAVDVINYLNS